MKSILLGVLLAVGGSAQVAVKPVNGSGTERVLGSAGREFTVFLTTVPTVAATATDGTTTLSAAIATQLIYCTNNHASTAFTLTITDAAGNVYVPAVSLPASSVTGVVNSAMGLNFVGGLKWSISSGSSVQCQIQGVFR